MILTIYAIFLAVSILFIFVGEFSEVTLLSLIGTSMIFILGTLLLFSGAVYKSGENVSTSYFYVNGSLNNTFEFSVDNYSNLKDDNTHWLGLLMSFAGVLGFGGVLMQMRKPKRDD